MNTESARDNIHVLLVDDDPNENLILQRLFRNLTTPTISLEYVGDIAKAVECVTQSPIDIVLLDNRLVPNNDFRETAPQLRNAGFTGPIGIISSDITGQYFQKFPEYGADFRLGKDEIDAKTIAFILEEYTRNPLPDDCVEDYL
ncbi:CheY-like chemotaxis protein [Hoeflea marina]|uniref:CheY-like chemotaxis protein n=1 Tax=Hoeflea marina TaxID=274592 RepID=A0A317PRA9_9HYPH|nr:response regulator [Hoeflea marina]PWW04008.1 CheY-like chemotaxis protein [Hoeflea marina]